MKGKGVKFDVVINKFGKQGEKTGWRYIEIPKLIAQQLYPGNNKSFRVSGKIDRHLLEKVALLPMGDGNFILPLNTAICKGIGKNEGHNVILSLKHDKGELLMDQDLLDCLEEDPVAKEFFLTLSPGHRNYFSKWIASAKTDATKTKRIAMTLEALVRRIDFAQMLRAQKGQ
jgi:Domain of unknown function (DUF1905)/Bacteriocin-protection, YdeI or OmpD-Associated